MEDLTDVDIMSNGNTVEVPEETEEITEDVVEETPEEQVEETTEGDEKPNEEDPEQSLQEDIDKQKTADEDTKKLLTDKGVDFEALLATYKETGALSEDQYKTLADAGFPQTVVDAYIAGSEAQADKFTTTVKSYVGGNEGFDKVADFVRSQGEAAVTAFNKVMDTADIATIKQYLGGVKAQMEAKYGTQKATVLGKANVSKPTGFTDQGEMIKAMSDPRYGRDAKYTKSVEKRVTSSKFIG